MTPEELLRPRYKVMADYPNSIYKVGEVVQQLSTGFFNTAFFEQYPHLFQPLQWWEERKPEEMPKYMKVVKRIGFPEDVGMIFPASPGAYRPFMKYGFTTNKNGFVSGFDNVILECFEPATIEEYLEYIKQKEG